MKRLIVIVAVFTMVSVLLFSLSEAADSTGPITVRASIPESTIRLSWGMSKVDSKYTEDSTDDVWTADARTMDFGTLVHELGSINPCYGSREAGLWYSPYYYAVFLGVISTSGRQYTIKSSSAGLTGPGGKLPSAWGIGGLGCYDITKKVFVPCPEGTLGSTGPADQADKLLYKSANPPTKNVTVRADYAIPSFKASATCAEVLPFTGYVPIPLSQKGGNYQGTVTITVTD